MFPSDDRKPMKVSDSYWIQAYNCSDKPNPASRGNGGKWLVFVRAEELDDLWAKIREATEKGELGATSKTATARPNSNAQNENIKVICVYTYDYTDENDVLRIRRNLRELGVTWKIPYKSNNSTKQGAYRVKGDKKISIYYE